MRAIVLHLVLFEGPERRAVVVGASPFVIGRSSESHLQLSDVQVSRRHAELRQDPSGWRIRDCGSRFGTFVNDVKTEEGPLSPGDRIRLGQTELRVEPGDPGTSTSSAHFDFRQVNALLAGLRALGSTQVLDEVLAIVLDSALELTGAERGFILLAESDGRLELRLARSRGGITLKSAQTSRRIPEEVFSTGTDRIVTDLMDEGLAARHAGTVALGIRHVLCTPLKVVQYAAGGERRIGVLYIDSRERGYLRSAGALHALAAEAAVVIENARLYQEVVGKERVEQELRIAAEMQRALLPPPRAETASADLAAMTIPCRSVGGDLFDYSVQDGALSFAVADVAGKGSSAALLSAVVQGLFAAEAETQDGPDAVVTRINRSLCRRALAARFVTVFYGQLASDGSLRYCNAGHNPPLLVSKTGIARLDVGGTVLGLFANGTFENATVKMSPGDALVLFSDGVTEAEDADGNEFGDDGLIGCLTGAPFHSAADVLARVQDAVSRFCGSAPPRDDLTLMVVVAR
jgi:serine phosphatase RsbU (regulator of sigma subunit)/pSer/pThr/pTyr-binding forkhead associated (FHA) protein